MNETWKDIVGTFGQYQVSSLGRVRSFINTYHVLKFDKKINGAGYYNVSLGRLRDAAVHRLVAETFLERPHRSKTQVNHKNFIKTDNRVENLEWVTPKQNIQHALKNGRMDEHIKRLSLRSRGAKNPKAKLNLKQVQKIRTLAKQGKTSKELALLYNVSKSTISAIRQNKIWIPLVF